MGYIVRHIIVVNAKVMDLIIMIFVTTVVAICEVGRMIKYKIMLCVMYFIILYVIAWISTRDIKEDDVILGLNKSQWRALLILWIPVLTVFTK